MSQTLDNLTYTWNDAGTTFTGIKYNVTDTASAAVSLLMDLQVGGVSCFRISKGGSFTFGKAGWTGLSLLTPLSEYSSYGGFTFGSGGDVTLYSASGALARYSLNSSPPYFHLTSNAKFGWSSGSPSSTGDTCLYRDAANTIAQRNSTSAQTFRTYGTFTDGSNYRRVALSMSTAGVAELKPEGAGTGASGNVLHISGLPTSNPGPGILWNNAGTPAIGT